MAAKACHTEAVVKACNSCDGVTDTAVAAKAYNRHTEAVVKACNSYEGVTDTAVAAKACHTAVVLGSEAS